MEVKNAAPVQFVSVTEAARRLGVGKTLLYTQIQAGAFPHRRIGDRIVIPVRALEKLAELDDDRPTVR